jgi:hypothetical protein
MAHYNQEQLNDGLKDYLYVHIRECEHKLELEKKTFLSPKLTDDNKLLAECNIEIWNHRLNFYQTQLNNL